MGWLDKIFFTGAKEAAGGIGQLAKDIREAITGELPAELKIKQEEFMLESDKGQVTINVEEAKSDNLFKSGWRPFIGWICGFGLAYQFLLYPFLAWLSLNMGWKSPPVLDVSQLLTLVFGMLGLGYYRTKEKMNK